MSSSLSVVEVEDSATVLTLYSCTLLFVYSLGLSYSYLLANSTSDPPIITHVFAKPFTSTVVGSLVLYCTREDSVRRRSRIVPTLIVTNALSKKSLNFSNDT